MFQRKQFLFQENFSTGANLSFGNLKMNLQSDEIINAEEFWEEFAPIIKSEKIRKPEIEFL